MAALLERLADRVAVGDRAQVVDALQLRARQLQPSRARAGGDQQRVVADVGAVALELHTALGRIDIRHGMTEQQLDLLVLVEGLVLDEQILALGLATQVVLAQRRALVGELRLGADQQNPSVEAALAQLDRRFGACEAGANDHKCLVAHELLVPDSC